VRRLLVVGTVVVGERIDDWWLSWVPLRHIGGPAFTYFEVNILVDQSRSTVARVPDFRKVS
jgi:hypothetical protein